MKRLIIFAFIIAGISTKIYCQDTIKISFDDQSYFENTQTYKVKSDLPDGQYLVFRKSELKVLFCSGEIIKSEKTGTWTWYNRSGLKLREVPYIDNKIHGEVLSYYPTGEISSKSQYSKGLREGKMTRWYNTGEIKLEAYFSNDQPYGTWKFFNTDGNVIKKENY